MDKRLQQRLIGAAVLIALAVIFLPMLLSGGGSKPVAVKMKLPPEPNYHFNDATHPPLPPATSQAMPAEVAPLPQLATSPPAPAVAQVPAAPTPVTQVPTPAPAEKTAVQQPASKPAAAPAHTVSKPVSKPKPPVPPPSTVTAPPGKPVVTAWVVQVASLVDENGANMLRDRLRKEGFDSYIDRFRHAGKTYYRVRVGPRLSKPKAEAMLAHIDRAVKLKGMVVPYP